jgi:hypothetical protein
MERSAWDREQDKGGEREEERRSASEEKVEEFNGEGWEGELGRREQVKR